MRRQCRRSHAYNPLVVMCTPCVKRSHVLICADDLSALLFICAVSSPPMSGEISAQVLRNPPCFTPSKDLTPCVAALDTARATNARDLRISESRAIFLKESRERTARYTDSIRAKSVLDFLCSLRRRSNSPNRPGFSSNFVRGFGRGPFCILLT